MPSSRDHCPASRGAATTAPLRVLVATNMWPTAREPWFGSFVKDQSEDLRAVGLRVEVMHFDGRSDALEYARAARAIWRRVESERFDVVHAHYGLTGAVAAMQRLVPVVTTFHGSDTGFLPWQRHISWVVARRTRSIFVSRNSAKQLGCRSPIVIPAAVDTELFTPFDRREARRALGWAEEVQYVLFPGARHNKVKRVDLFDAAIEEVGRQARDVVPVHLEGYSRADVAVILNAVDVTLMTSDAEGSPLVVRESLAVETPVVSVPVGDVTEVITGLRGCSIAPRDASALATCVIEALEAPRDSSLRRRALRYSRRRTAERVALVLDSAARSASRRLR